MTATEDVRAEPGRRIGRVVAFAAVLVAVEVLLFGLSWWTLVLAPGWPTGVVVVGTVLFVAAAIGFPVLMNLGHRRANDPAARTSDVLLGVIGVLFVWCTLAQLVRLPLLATDLSGTAVSRVVAAVGLVITIVLLAWGYVEAMRLPRVAEVSVRLDRLGAGLDGLRVVLITDTHYGPIDRADWSRRVIDVVNELDGDIVCHTGDIADGSVNARLAQAAPLGDVRATLARAYVTGNHEYYGEAQAWMDHMAQLGWSTLHNRHLVVERGGDRLVVAGVDDRTAGSSGTGHRADHAAALAGADPDLPVLLLAHQPQQISLAVEHGVDLQLSGHTHGGQIWPFHYLVRLDQPSVAGLTRHGDRTQLYTSRGTGFWGPPFRVFAPSEITVLTLRSGAA
ncbi:metallophosphoesterase [Actinocatenispora sera]|uniref:metallophosphoesterase n=1 Tax=Actinocatenispora sera TaxID=390989 RepID=UPI00054CE4BE|nr:metallophosphoesterase [Actinocatenispora sera]